MIKGLIKEMVAKLVAEANEEATQKAFCDEEKANIKTSKEDKMMTSDVRGRAERHLWGAVRQ